MKRVVLSLFLLSLARCCLGGEYARAVSYEGEVLVKCSSLQTDVIQHLQEVVDVWRVGADGSVDFRVSREEFQRMKGDLPECREDRNIEDLVRDTERRYLNKTQQDEWFEAYHPYSEIVDWYSAKAVEYPQLATFVSSIGESIEGRAQPAFHITATQGQEDVNRIYYQCQIHAREWISAATCMYIVDQLLVRYESDERVKSLLESVEFVFIIIMNPDGYEYTWTTDRLWRKNRRLHESGCYGVDLNRNYPIEWGEGGGSTNPCSETYEGTGPASEPEIQNTIQYFQDSLPIVGSVDWHSFGQLLLRPYGWSNEDAPDEPRLKEIGDQMSAAIFEESGRRYTSQKGFGLYKTTGTARDWFYSEAANEFNKYRSAGYTIELPDTGQYGFLLPPDEIIPTGKEILPAVLLFAEELDKVPIPKPEPKQ